MIERVIHIQNVGRYEDAKLVGKFGFKRWTYLYSENARGKSTLSAILRSLSDGNCNAVKARHTLGAANAPSIDVRIGGSNYRYDGNAWSATYPNMLVFDSAFVTEHVYSGDSVSADQRLHLHQFAIGSDGVKLAEEISKRDELGRTLASLIRDKEGIIRSHIKGDMSIAQFCALQSDADVDAKIEGKRKQIESLINSERLEKRPGLIELRVSSSREAAITEMLASTLDNIAAEAASMTQSHIADCMDQRGEIWTAQGLEYIKDNKCPFCGQGLAGIDLIDAYRSYFSEAYKRAIELVAEEIRRLRSDFSDAELVRLESNVRENESRTEFWKEHIDADYPIVDPKVITNAARKYRDGMLVLLERKQHKPLERIEVDAETKDSAEKLIAASAVVVAYNAKVVAVNEAIVQWKAKLAAGDLNKARAELAVLENIRSRHLPEVAKECKEYQGYSNQRQENENAKERAKAALATKTDELLSKYQDGINRLLSEFGASFTIADVKSQYGGGRARANYKLVVKDEQVDVGNPQTPADEPSFRTILSDGDKSTLAFAFFLARLEQEPSIANMIIIIDDPISSLDIHRRLRTWHAIKTIGSNAMQVIVCSHEAHFLRALWDHTAKADRCAGEICAVARGSDIQLWEIETLTCGDYFQRVRIVAGWLDDHSSHHPMLVAKCLRPLLESNLRVRFPLAFADKEWLGDFISKIRQAKPGEPLVAAQAQLRELDPLNEYSKQFHHDQNPHADTVVINKTELAQNARAALGFLGA